MTLFTLTEADREVYRRFAGLALARHTSYPIAPAWKPNYDPADFREDLARSAACHRPLSLYVHIPFCERLCYYCACTKEIVPPGKRGERDPGEGLLEGLQAEAER